MRLWTWLLSAGVGALIGWSTNRIAIRMLFRPRRGWVVPGVGWVIQGLIPRRRGELARLIAQSVAKDLISPEALWAKIRESGLGDQAKETVALHIGDRLRSGLPAFIPPAVANAVVSYLEEAARRETDRLIERVMHDAQQEWQDRIDIAALVEDRVNALDLAELERLVTRVAGSELRYIEALGAGLGGLIGLVQASLLHFIG